MTSLLSAPVQAGGTIGPVEGLTFATVMTAFAAIEVPHRREAAADSYPVRRADLVVRLVAQHGATTGGPGRAVACGAVDEVLDPVDTRRRLVQVFAGLPEQRRGDRANPPL